MEDWDWISQHEDETKPRKWWSELLSPVGIWAWRLAELIIERWILEFRWWIQATEAIKRLWGLWITNQNRMKSDCNLLVFSIPILWIVTYILCHMLTQTGRNMLQHPVTGPPRPILLRWSQVGQIWANLGCDWGEYIRKLTYSLSH